MSTFKKGDMVRIVNLPMSDLSGPGINQKMRAASDSKGVYTVIEIRPNGNLRVSGDFSGRQDWFTFKPGWLQLIVNYNPAPVLESGMKVLCRDGCTRIVIGDRLCRIGVVGGYSLLSSFDEDLRNTIDVTGRLDIMKVMKPAIGCYITYIGDVIWERKEEEVVEELTVAEIEAKLGYKVKVVK